MPKGTAVDSTTIPDIAFNPGDGGLVINNVYSYLVLGRNDATNLFGSGAQQPQARLMFPVHGLVSNQAWPGEFRFTTSNQDLSGARTSPEKIRMEISASSQSGGSWPNLFTLDATGNMVVTGGYGVKSYDAPQGQVTGQFDAISAVNRSRLISQSHTTAGGNMKAGWQLDGFNSDTSKTASYLLIYERPTPYPAGSMMDYASFPTADLYCRGTISAFGNLNGNYQPSSDGGLQFGWNMTAGAGEGVIVNSYGGGGGGGIAFYNVKGDTAITTTTKPSMWLDPNSVIHLYQPSSALVISASPAVANANASITRLDLGINGQNAVSWPGSFTFATANAPDSNSANAHLWLNHFTTDVNFTPQQTTLFGISRNEARFWPRIDAVGGLAVTGSVANAGWIASSLNISLGAPSQMYIDAVGQDTTTPGQIHFRTFTSSTAQINEPLLLRSDGVWFASGLAQVDNGGSYRGRGLSLSAAGQTGIYLQTTDYPEAWFIKENFAASMRERIFAADGHTDSVYWQVERDPGAFSCKIQTWWAGTYCTVNAPSIGITGICAVGPGGLQLSSQGGSCWITDSQGFLYLNSPNGSQMVNVLQNFSVSGTKSFVIPHPLDEEKSLYHSCLEGPENGVYYRGEVKLVAHTATVELPAYFELLTYDDDRSVLLTQILEADDDDLCILAATRVVDGKFRVKGSVKDALVSWEVKAARKVGGIEDQPVLDRLQVSRTRVRPRRIMPAASEISPTVYTPPPTNGPQRPFTSPAPQPVAQPSTPALVADPTPTVEQENDSND